MRPDPQISRFRSRRWHALSLLAVVVVVASMTVAAPASAKKPSDTTTTTTTTTTVAPDSGLGGFDQWEDASALEGYQASDYPGSMYWLATKSMGANVFWNAGYSGAGIDVALIDTGVLPVDGLRWPGKVINGPDLSFESQADNLRYLDTYGHGTHLAGIIAGRSDATTDLHLSGEDFAGIAPDARIVNVKVADAHGAVDVTQVIAALDWVVEHRNDNGMNIRVINLAYGTDSTQAYDVDPLSLAVERAWRAGIVVVVAAGNDGNNTPLRNPATNPYVIAVGASENAGSFTQIRDDVVPAFSNCGTTQRFVDLVAPGKSIVSLRAPGSYADEFHPEAVVSNGYFLGSGTSQAAAMVTGAVALLLDQRPELTPDQVKQILAHDSAENLEGESSMCQGGGSLNLTNAFDVPTPTAESADQTYTPSMGGGSLEAARGFDHVYDEGVPLEGETDIMGNPWPGYDCTTTETGKGKDRVTTITCDSLWNGGDFNGASWSGASWSGASWSGASWSGASWSGASWSSKSWSGASWSGASWSGASWSGASWSGASWSGASWSGLSWH